MCRKVYIRTVTVKFYIYTSVYNCMSYNIICTIQPFNMYTYVLVYIMYILYIYTFICIHNCIQLNTVGVTFIHTHTHTMQTLRLGRSVYSVSFRYGINSV